MREIVLVGLLAACAPAGDGLVEQQRTRDHEDGDRLAAAIAALPGVQHADVLLARPVADPLALVATPPATLAIVAVVDSADPDRTRATVATLAHATLALDPTIIVERGAPRVIPAASTRPLKAAFTISLVALGGLAAALARQRRGKSAQ